MPGYVIHLAVAEEYLKKHKIPKEDYIQFIEGVIFPDSVKDKSLTHYGKGSSEANLYAFLQENNLETSFKRGYFLHLLTDYLFYNKYIPFFSKDMYHDYDLLNKDLINKYHVKLPEKVRNEVFFKNDGKLKILSTTLVDNFIKNVSDINIDIISKEVKENPIKWTKIKPLIKI